MNRILEQMYFHSPVTMQNMAVSAYGLLMRNQRYGGKHHEYLSQLEKSQFLSAGDIGQLQARELRRLAEHIFMTVPFYAGYAETNRLSASDFAEVEDLRKLPIISKDQIRGNPEQFASAALKNKSFKLHTSGTSGKPLTVYCDNDSRRLHYAFWQRLRGWFGIHWGMRRATFFGRIAIPAEAGKPPFWRRDAFQNNYLFSSYHMSEQNLEHYYEALTEIQPEELIGYPSSLFVLSKYMKRHHLKSWGPKAIFATAETLLEHQRALIEDVFERMVVDQYGCTEMALFVSQCERGTYHVHPEHGILEVLDEHGNPAAPGEEGEAVCTGFVNYATPMVRYRLGDRLTLSEEPCSCGRSFPVVKQIIGRIDDILFTPDGRPLGRLDPVFKGMSGIYETQIIQTDPDRLVFRINADNNFSRQKKAELLYEVQKRTGGCMRIEIELVDEIRKDRNGKFRSVISQIERTPELSHAN